MKQKRPEPNHQSSEKGASQLIFLTHTYK